MGGCPHPDIRMLPRNLGTAEDILIKNLRAGGRNGGREKQAGQKILPQPRQQKFRVILCLGDILQESLKAFPSRFHGELAAQLHDFDEFCSLYSLSSLRVPLWEREMAG